VRASTDTAFFNSSAESGDSATVVFPLVCWSADAEKADTNAITLSPSHFRNRGIICQFTDWTCRVQSGLSELQLRRQQILTCRSEVVPRWWLLVKVHVVVMPKQSVLDPQGVAVKNALRDLGLDTVDSVRVGKLLELEFTTPPNDAKLEEVCRDLLSNPVIEDYTIRRH
jgi:phosphoribosylformylglycinamidine synthase PurS subunit